MTPLLRFAALSLAGFSCLAPAAAEVFERLAGVPEGWKYDGVPAGSQALRLKIALKQHDSAGFHQAFLDMSNPKHADYGKHFGSYEEMKRMLLPTDSSVTAVRDWLDAQGVTHVEQDADWLNLQTTVEQANTLLSADFLWYASDDDDDDDEEGGGRILRTLEYSIPDDLFQHIDLIQPTTRFGQMRPNRATLHFSHGTPALDVKKLLASVLKGSLDHCDNQTTPACLHAAYNTNNYAASAKGGSKVAFASYLEEYARYADLNLFKRAFLPQAGNQSFDVVSFNGGLNDQNAASDSGEANLDAQFIMGMSTPLPVTEYSTGGRGELIPDLSQPNASDNSNEPYLEFLEGILKLDAADLPQVISTSYGEDEQTIPESYARKVCDMYKELGSRGVSVIFSSGDSGIGSACQTNDGTKTTHFPPQFPASCPWVTSVGATTGQTTEKAVYFSSGGFSDYWPRESYQDDAVESYLEKYGDEYADYFNSEGRAFPDVAARGTNFAVYDKGRLGSFAGTSCSAPVFAGLVGLLNDARLAVGKPVLGFLNPFLYSAEGGFRDITLGRSLGCDGNNRFGGTPNGSPVIPGAGWNATEGWDAVTGLGVPDFEVLKALALAV